MPNLQSSLLFDDEPPAFEIINGDVKSSLLLVCDHASNRVPCCLNNLGLSEAQLEDHIGWDPGAVAVARQLAIILNAPLVLSNYSRLVIDCNRPLHSAELIPKSSAGVNIPGNLSLSPQEKSERISQIFTPYHQAIDHLIDTRLRNFAGPRLRVLLSIHSFTPVLNNLQRPWNIGIAARSDHRFARLLYEAMAVSEDINVGFNQPYQIDDDFDYSVPVHGEGRQLHSAMVEIRQDGLTTPQQQIDWATRLCAAYLKIEQQLLSL